MALSTYNAVPLRLVGASGAHRDSSYSNQETMNYRIEAHGSGSHPALLTPWPGSKSFSTRSATKPRGIYAWSGKVYKISDQTLYSYDSLGTETTIGTIAGTGRCVMADYRENLIIATGDKWYQLTGSTLTEFSSPDGTQGNSVAFLSKYAIFDGSGQTYWVSDFGDPDSIQSNNFAEGESNGDDLQRIYAFKERVYMFGEKSIETYTIGTGNPPLTKAVNGTMATGLSDIHTVANSINYVYFRATDGLVYRFSSNQPINITSGYLAQKFQSYNKGNAVAWTAEFDGVFYYVINFPDNNATWAFSEKAGELSPGVNDWIQLSSGSDKDRYIGEMYVRAFNKDLVEKKGSGDILELDYTTYTDDGDTVVRVRETAPIHGGLLGQEGARLEMSWITIVLKKGVGTASGDGVDPRLYIQGSFDGSNSYSNQDELEIGRTGESMIKVTWYHVESFYEAAFKITGYDPVFVSLHGASIGLKVVGD